MICFGHTMCDRSRPDSCFVGECGPLETNYQYPDNPALYSTGTKCPIYNSSERRPYIFNIDNNNGQGGHYIYRRHNRNHFFGYLGNTAYSPNNYGSDQDSGDYAKPKRISLEGRDLSRQLLKGLIGMEHIAPAKGCANGHNGKESGENLTQPFHFSFFQPVPQIIHRTAKNPAIG